MNIEQRLEIIEERNRRVEADKAWEVSLARRTLIAGITYLVALLVLYMIGSSNVFLGALVPMFGFVLSTLTLPVAKGSWIRRHKSHDV